MVILLPVIYITLHFWIARRDPEAQNNPTIRPKISILETRWQQELGSSVFALFYQDIPWSNVLYTFFDIE